MTEMQEKFQEKLRQELGVNDLVIDWSSYRRTPPVYLRNYDPSVCKSSAYISSDIMDCKEILFYYSLRDLCRKKFHLNVYQDGIILKVYLGVEKKVRCYTKNNHGVPGYTYKHD